MSESDQRIRRKIVEVDFLLLGQRMILRRKQKQFVSAGVDRMKSSIIIMTRGNPDRNIFLIHRLNYSFPGIGADTDGQIRILNDEICQKVFTKTFRKSGLKTNIQFMGRIQLHFINFRKKILMKPNIVFRSLI